MNWWLEHGLDGIVGGVVGGAATGVAVWATLWQQQRHATAQLRVEQALRLAETTRQLSDLALMERSPDFIRKSFDWNVDVVVLAQSLHGAEPCFSTLLLAASGEVGAGGAGGWDAEKGLTLADPQRLVAGLTNAQKLLQRRAFSPEYFKMSKQECEVLERAIKDGSFIG